MAEQPDRLDRDEVLWRYMDLSKLLDLLRTSELHFTRADQMEDLWEGAGGVHYRNESEKIEFEASKLSLKSVADIRRFSREAVYLNCWHRGAAESYAMWRLYAPYETGVAIKTTVDKLTRSIHPLTMIAYAAVKYVDFEKVSIPLAPIHYPYVYKRTCYAYESEFRIVELLDPPTREVAGEMTFMHADPEHPKFLRQGVILNTLIDAIYVSPDSPAWVASTIMDVVGRYAPEVTVVHSVLGQTPEVNDIP